MLHHPPAATDPLPRLPGHCTARSHAHTILVLAALEILEVEGLWAPPVQQAGSAPVAPATEKEVSAAELEQLLQQAASGGVVLLDVRSAQEVAAE